MMKVISASTLRCYLPMRFYRWMKTNRHSFWIIATLLAPLLLMVYAAGTGPATSKGKYFVYVGTYTEEGSRSKGIYAYRFDPARAEVTAIGLVAETVNPSFLAVHPNHRFLYAVNEVGKYKGQSSGAISAFAIDQTTGKLTLLNEVPSRGADPCYVTVDKSGKYVLVANYTGGSVAVFPVLEDGRLGETSAFVQHQGQGTNPQRQEGPHAHSIDLSADNHYALVDDLGLDQVITYRFDAAKGSLTPNEPTFAKADAGAGPRHFAFHPSGKFGYGINEMHSTVTVFAYDATGGTLLSLQKISTLPRDFTGQNDDAEVQVHPSGKFLYASNRGHDSIAVFAIDPTKGTLTPVEDVLTRGKTPRSFEIDPTGSLLFAANQKSDTIVIFRIDTTTGRLTPTGKVLEVAAPVCVKFVAIE
jgi:6-phosphogluconolactonase